MYGHALKQEPENLSVREPSLRTSESSIEQGKHSRSELLVTMNDGLGLQNAFGALNGHATSMASRADCRIAPPPHRCPNRPSAR